MHQIECPEWRLRFGTLLTATGMVTERRESRKAVAKWTQTDAQCVILSTTELRGDEQRHGRVLRAVYLVTDSHAAMIKLLISVVSCC